MTNAMHILNALAPVQKGPAAQAVPAVGAGVALEGPLAFQTQLAAQGTDGTLSPGDAPLAGIPPVHLPQARVTLPEISLAAPTPAAPEINPAPNLVPASHSIVTAAQAQPQGNPNLSNALATALPAATSDAQTAPLQQSSSQPALGISPAMSSAATSAGTDAPTPDNDPRLAAFTKRAVAIPNSAPTAAPKPAAEATPAPASLTAAAQPAAPNTSAPFASAAAPSAFSGLHVPAPQSSGLEPPTPQQAATSQRPSGPQVVQADLSGGREAPVRLEVRTVPEPRPAPVPQPSAQLVSTSQQILTTAANPTPGTMTPVRTLGLQARSGNANSASANGNGTKSGALHATMPLPIAGTPVAGIETLGADALGSNWGTGGITLESASAMAGRGAATSTGGGPQATQTPVEQVAVQIAAAARAGMRQISIQLKPAALGEINVELQVQHDGHVRAVVLAERPETLELLQRDARGLERALQDAGLKTDSGGLSFGLRGEGRHANTGEHRSASTAYTDSLGLDEAEASVALAYSRGGIGDHAVDIHV